ncbi:hypothetical protein AAFF_G00206260 [Aldrovandia affinis]|uniref:Uncharacterized protein n=1 Tax=Aldrovandia affinis TaxID=143900 RepID=A0AAD7W5Q7_9TELE|nr:hypothetical protein AAFF_G00206260 [Aldrovandia affinis]
MSPPVPRQRCESHTFRDERSSSRTESGSKAARCSNLGGFRTLAAGARAARGSVGRAVSEPLRLLLDKGSSRDWLKSSARRVVSSYRFSFMLFGEEIFSTELQSVTLWSVSS